MRFKQVIGFLAMLFVLAVASSARADTPDGTSSNGSSNYISANLYAQLSTPTNPQTFTGPVNLTISSATNHKIVLAQTSGWTTNATYNYQFTLEYFGGTFGGIHRTLTTKEFTGYPNTWITVSLAPNTSTTVSASLSDSQTFIADPSNYFAEAWVTHQWRFGSASAVEHDHTFTVN
jgi:hypothetical protein